MEVDIVKRMNFMETFEDEGFVYKLTIKPSVGEENLYTRSQGEGYCCLWTITMKENQHVDYVKVTDDDCEPIVFYTVEAAVKGARDFVSL